MQEGAGRGAVLCALETRVREESLSGVECKQGHVPGLSLAPPTDVVPACLAACLIEPIFRLCRRGPSALVLEEQGDGRRGPSALVLEEQGDGAMVDAGGGG